MIRINLAAVQNEKIRCCLESPEYATREFKADSTAELLKACTDTPGSCTLFQVETGSSGITNCSMETLKELAAATRLVCCAEKLTDQARSMLISAGVCDCLCNSDAHTAASYLAALSGDAAENSGTFAILDGNRSHVRIISGIVSRFGYSIRQVESIDEFYSYISTNVPAMTLINLGTDVDFNRFIRESHSSSIKKSPVIAYKDLSEGLFVHEVLNGLGKITKLILSPEELYRMLIDMLMKKSIISGTSQLNNSVEYEKNKHYRGMTLQQVYYDIHPDPCGQESLISHNRTEIIMQELEGIRRSLVLGEGIKWLARTGSGKPTCGAGA
ncbi:MAG TPA: hypothetical protein PK514_11165 [Spirochaetota bacterium]|nr:hypothetical protein [Spirochaetota bacterium]